jgi:hypothetical protein
MADFCLRKLVDFVTRKPNQSIGVLSTNLHKPPAKSGVKVTNWLTFESTYQLIIRAAVLCKAWMLAFRSVIWWKRHQSTDRREAVSWWKSHQSTDHFSPIFRPQKSRFAISQLVADTGID